MPLTLGSTTATAGTAFSTTVSGFTTATRFRTRQLVNNGQGQFQLVDADDTTMTLRAAAADLVPGQWTVAIDGGVDGTLKQTITVAPAGYVAPPALVVVPPALATVGDTINVPAPTLSGLTGTPVYSLVDAVGGQPRSPGTLTFNTSTGALTGTASQTLEGVAVKATVGGRSVTSPGFTVAVQPAPVGGTTPVVPTLGTPVLSGTLTSGTAASGVTLSGLTDGSTAVFNIAGITVGTSGTTRTVTGTPNAPGALSLQETLTGATGSPKTTVLGSVASAAGRAASFAFTDRGVIYDTPAEMTNTAGGLFYPTKPIPAPTTGIWAGSSVKWFSYASTDHDTSVGGIFMWVSNLTDPSDPAGWKILRDAYDAGYMNNANFGAKPSSNIVVTQGNQSETPQVNLIGSKYVMTYSIGANGAAALTPPYTRNQCSVRAVSDNGFSWTNDAGPLLTLTEAQGIGNGHTGYIRWGPNPFTVGPAAGYAYVGYSLEGGGDQGTNAMWGCNEPIAGAWTFLQSLMPQSGRIDPNNNARTGFSSIDTGSIRALPDGTFSVIGAAVSQGSGTDKLTGQVAELQMDATGTQFISQAVVLIPRGSNSRVQASTGLANLHKIGSTYYATYSGRTDLMKNVAAAATSPVLDPKDTVFTPLSPAIPASLTTRSADFRTLSALPSFLTGTDFGTGQAAPTFDSGGMIVNFASQTTPGRYGFYGEEIPAGVSYVDFFFDDFRCTGGTAYRELRFGLTSAPAGTGLGNAAGTGIQMDSISIRMGAGGTGSGGAATSPTGTTANVSGSLQRIQYKDATGNTAPSGTDTRTFSWSEKHPGGGYGTVAPTSTVHLGMRWFVAQDKLFTLAESKASGGVEMEPIYIDPDFRVGGARRSGRPIRPYLALLGVANQACVQRIGSFRYRFG